MTSEVWVDRPKPEGWPWVGWVFAVLGLLFATLAVNLVIGPDWLFDLVFLAAFVFVFGLIGWTLLGTCYELTDSTLYCRAGPSYVRWDLGDIERVEVLDGFVARLQLMVTTQLLNRWSRPLLVVDRRGRRVLLGPSDPVEMRDEILRRRDAIRGNDGA